MISFVLNEKQVAVDVPGDTPLLWVIHDDFKLKGSKIRCGAGLSGACSMHLDGESVRTVCCRYLQLPGVASLPYRGSALPTTYILCNEPG